MNSRALLLATLVGTVLQVVMVVAGHSNKSIAGLFAVGGMGFSLVAGLAYAAFARGGSTSSLAIGGLVAGAVCAFIGIFVSYMLGDVPVTLLALGTVSSAVTGALGGWLGKFLFRAGVVVATFAIAMAGTPSKVNAQTLTPVSHTSFTAATTADFAWLVGRWEGKNATPYDKALTSTQPRVTTYRRLDANTFVGHSDIINDDGKPGVVELTYRRLP